VIEAESPDGFVPTGTLNFRDVGGLPAGPGRRVRSDLLYRSDTLQFLTEQDVALLVDVLRLRTEIDLRRADEAAGEGRGLLAGTDVAHAHFPFSTPSSVRHGDVPVLDRIEPVVEHYLGYLDFSSASMVATIATLARPGALPAVVHCAAGKDRTGVAIAFALSVAGVDDQSVAAEYAAQPERVARVVERLRALPGYGGMIDVLPTQAHLTPPEYMLTFLGRVRSRWGSPWQWLIEHGVPEADLVRLAETLTEPF
jgi:hypothetical protein